MIIYFALDFFDEGDYEDFQLSRSQDSPHGSNEPSTSKRWVHFQEDVDNSKFSKDPEPSQQNLEEFTAKEEDEWQYPLNLSEFFQEISKSNGKGMGVQGNNNSCYMDSSLFSLFAFNETLDNCLVKLKSESSKLKRVIRDSIIFPMRNRPYVPHENVHRLRKILAKNIREDYLSRYMGMRKIQN